jgi:DNA polymerase III alpha subunit (gram-positive type)
MSKHILFLDTETTGLPNRWNSPYNEWPHMVSLAYMLCEEDGKVIDQMELIIKPEGYTIPKEASDIHGITQEIEEQKGNDLQMVLIKLLTLVEIADLIVFHNQSFDVGIITGEQMRMGFGKSEYISSQKPKIFCTKETSTNILKIPSNRGGYKWPSLAELCAFCGVENKGAHNAMNDVEATKECYFYMVDKGYF